MSKFIPFVHNQFQCDLIDEFYAETDLVRVPLNRIDKLTLGSASTELWIDPAIDGYHTLRKLPSPFKRKRDTGAPGRFLWEQYADYLRQFPNYDVLVHQAPELRKIPSMVEGVLDACHQHDPQWLSVPQLPIVNGSANNKINTALARATSAWRNKAGYKGKLIVPMILTRYAGQYDKKTLRNANIAELKKCYDRSTADGIWIVDSDLTDFKGVGTYQKRLEQLVNLHQEVRDKLPNAVLISGPYWGMNLVLWARSLCDHPAIAVGSGFRYLVPGMSLKTPKTRIALDSLRRWVQLHPDLRRWLDSVLSAPPSDIAKAEFEEILSRFDLFMDFPNHARRQVAEFYGRWIHEHEKNEQGRALNLFQDLSAAYVVGSQLEELPKSEAPGRRPEVVAQQLMLNCL